MEGRRWGGGRERRDGVCILAVDEAGGAEAREVLCVVF